MTMIEKVAQSLMRVTARPPASEMEAPVLALDPDFDDLPRDETEGTADDEITQEAVLRLARAAILSMWEPTPEMIERVAQAIEQGVCEICGLPAIDQITPQDCVMPHACRWGRGTAEDQASAAIEAMQKMIDAVLTER